MFPELPLLDDVERSCLVRYLETLTDALGDELHEVIVFGSVARGESWPAGMRIRSDLDLLVVTATRLGEARIDELVDAIYRLILECGRPIAPQFRTREQFAENGTFRENVERDGIRIYPLAR